MKRIILFLLVIFFPVSSFAQDQSNIIRVAVLKDASQVKLTVKGYYKIVALKTNMPLSNGQNLKNALILPTDSGFKMDDVLFKIYGVKIIPKKEGTVIVNNVEFRGSIDIIRTTNKKLLVINHLDIEDYLKGVLYHEVSHLWPLEALKAQAIASRTFAYYEKINSKSRDYDLTNDIFSQVYGGKGSEKYLTNKAVDLTRGTVLNYNRKLFPAYFHATCGGHTESAKNIWKINIPPLKDTYCTFCKESPHYYWKAEIPLSDIEEKISKSYFELKNIKSISIESKNNTGRIHNLILKTESGVLLIPAKEFRLIIGPNVIRSTNFNVEVKNGFAEFTGKGWGHGVGMCQWGAFGMAKLGVKTEDILKFYYPKSKIFKMKD